MLMKWVVYGVDAAPRGCRRPVVAERGAIVSPDCRRRPSGAQPGAAGTDGWVIWWTGQTPRARSGKEWQGAQSRQCGAELVLPGPALGEMQGDATCFAGDAYGQGEEASSEGLGGCRRLTRTDAHGPASQVMRHHLYCQPDGVGREKS